MADEMTHQQFKEFMAAFEQRLDKRFDGIDEQFQQTHQAFADLKFSMNVQFEEARQNFKLSLEAVAGLGETTERGFATMRSEHAEHKALLEQAIRHVRERLEDVERHHPGA